METASLGDFYQEFAAKGEGRAEVITRRGSCIKDDRGNIFKGGENSVEEKLKVKWIHDGANFLRNRKGTGTETKIRGFLIC